MTYYHREPTTGSLNLCPTDSSCPVPHAEHFIKNAGTIRPVDQHVEASPILPSHRVGPSANVTHAHERATHRTFVVKGVRYETQRVCRGELLEGEKVMDHNLNIVWTVVSSSSGLVLANPTIPSFTLPTTGAMADAPAYLIL